MQDSQRLKHSFLLLVLCALLDGCQGVGFCNIIVWDATLNAQTTYELTFQPDNKLSFKEAYLKFSFPLAMGVTSVGGLVCTNRFPTSNAFTILNPACTMSVVGDYTVIQVNNLKTTADETIYSIRATPIQNGAVSGSFPGIICESFSATNTLLETLTSASNLEYALSEKTDGISLALSTFENGASSVLTVNFNVDQQVVAFGSITICMPSSDVFYQEEGLTLLARKSMVSGTPTLAVKYGTPSVSIVSQSITVQGSLDCLGIKLGNTAALVAGNVLSVTVTSVRNPLTAKQVSGFQIWTGDVSFNKIEYGDFAVFPITTVKTASGVVEVDPLQKQSSETNVMYTFSVITVNDIPKDGFFVLTVPGPVGVGSDPTNSLVLTCVQGCDSSAATLQWVSSTRQLTITNAFPTTASYLQGPSTLKFTLKGFTNPATSAQTYFGWASYASLSSSGFEIDKVSSMSMSVQSDGFCTVKWIMPSDNKYIYGIPSNYTVKAICDHAIGTEYTLKLVFPKEYLLIDNRRCKISGFQGQDPYYFCDADAASNTISLKSITLSSIPSKSMFEFTIDSIINPGTFKDTGVISLASVDSTGHVVDIGTFQQVRGYFLAGNITSFNVTALDTGVGQYPAKYRFALTPSGEIWQNAYFVIELPPELTVFNENALETKCGENLLGITYVSIHCVVSDNLITVENGFAQAPTTNLTDSDGLLLPPTISFDLGNFRNPRSKNFTAPFNITVFAKSGEKIYTWTQPDDPVVQMTTPATPQKIRLSRTSEQNGNFTEYTFSVTTTNYLMEGDKIQIVLPSPAFFNEDTQCYGRTQSLQNKLNCVISPDLTSLTMKLAFQYQLSKTTLSSGKARLLQQTTTIFSGQEYQFTLTNVRNPPSTAPTANSILYRVQLANDSSVIEEQSKNLEITNTIPGLLSQFKCGFVPSNFVVQESGNYTMQLVPLNFEKGMQIVVTLPEEVNFDAVDPICYGLTGVDTPVLSCTADRLRKTLTIKDAVNKQRTNPGQITIVISKLKNPSQNKISTSFGIQTFTTAGFALDALMKNMTVNFFCKFPCADCSMTDQNLCFSCYAASEFKIWKDFSCWETCPARFVATQSYNCTACESPCVDCEKEPNLCTSCVSGYSILSSKPGCRELVYWPFPFIISAIVISIVVLVSEIKTKKQSRYKEAFISLVSLVEISAWITLLGLYIYRSGFKVPTIIALIAVAVYFVLNFVHALVHPRLLLPKAPLSYKALTTQFSRTYRTVTILSYIVSFKFSLILVSHLFLKPKFAGNYSPDNWRTFSKFSLAFLCVPLPFMFAACALFLVSDGFFSYAGFVTIEVLFLSFVLAVLAVIDVCSAIECRTVGKNSEKRVRISVAKGEGLSDSDDINRVNRDSKRKDRDEFGDESVSDRGLLDEMTERMKRSEAELRRIEVYSAEQHAHNQELAAQLRMLQNQKIGKYRDFESDMVMDPVEEECETEEDQQIQLPRAPAFGRVEGTSRWQLGIGHSDVPIKLQGTDVQALEIHFVRNPTPANGYVDDRLSEGTVENLDAHLASHYEKVETGSRQGRSEIACDHGNALYSLGSIYEDESSQIGRNPMDAVIGGQGAKRGANAGKKGGLAKVGRSHLEKVNHTEHDHVFLSKPLPVYEHDGNESIPAHEVHFLVKERAVGTHLQTEDNVNFNQDLEAEGSVLQYLRKDDAAYGDVVSDIKRERQASPEQFANRITADGSRLPSFTRELTGEVILVIEPPRAFASIREELLRDDRLSTELYMAPHTATAGGLSQKSLETYQNFQNRIAAEFLNQTPNSSCDENQFYLNRDKAAYKQFQAQLEGDPSTFFKRNEAVRGELQNCDSDNDEQQYMSRVNASIGYGLLPKSSHRAGAVSATGAEYFLAKPDHGYVGLADNFQRQFSESSVLFEKNSGTADFDESGRSVSSEGIIADHKAFNSLTDVVEKALTKKVEIKLQQKFEKEPVPLVFDTAADFRKQVPSGELEPPRKTIIYSDKSSSSVNSLMEDTPSNYNIPNLRLEGKSLGMKAVLLNQQVYPLTLGRFDVNQPTKLTTIGESEPHESNLEKLYKSDDDQHQTQPKNTFASTGMKLKKKPVVVKTFAENKANSTQRSVSVPRPKKGHNKKMKARLMKDNYV